MDSTPPLAPPSPPAQLLLGDHGDLKAAAEDALRDAKVKFEALRQDGLEYIKAHPGKSVLAALGVGFLLGMILKD